MLLLENIRQNNQDCFSSIRKKILRKKQKTPFVNSAATFLNYAHKQILIKKFHFMKKILIY